MVDKEMDDAVPKCNSNCTGFLGEQAWVLGEFWVGVSRGGNGRRDDAVVDRVGSREERVEAGCLRALGGVGGLLAYH